MSAKAEAKHHREKKNNPHCSLFDVAMRIIFGVCYFANRRDDYRLLRITRAAITPGTHPQMVRMRTMSIEPHPRSNTANGGKIIDSNTLISDIAVVYINVSVIKKHRYRVGLIIGAVVGMTRFELATTRPPDEYSKPD